MRNRFAIFLSIGLLLLILVALNAASYVRVEREPDSEATPNRSTTHAGATGSRALYEFMQQSGHSVARWTRPASELLNESPARPATFIVIGPTRVAFKMDEARSVLNWVRQGGRLVVIDRTPNPLLVPGSQGWRVASNVFESPFRRTNTEGPEELIEGVRTVAPSQPTLLTRDVAAIQPSRYAGRLRAYKSSEAETDETGRAETIFGDWNAEDATPAWDDADENRYVAPVEHVADARGKEQGGGALLLDYAYGRGRIVLLSDPYIVSNGGIARADNLQLATNVAAGEGGLVVFDEYHQGLGSAGGGALRLLQGTPVLWIFGQGAFVALVILWSRGRRFARPLPAPRRDRRSKLEFVASMAELQQRARSHSLAVENIYARTRRALARYAGLDASAHYEQIAERAAARSGKDRGEIERLLADCERVLGDDAPLSLRESLALVRRLRQLEKDLGIRMRAREIRQQEKARR